MDVIALQTAGFAGAVASLGTSLTEEQAKLIGRSCKGSLLFVMTATVRASEQRKETIQVCVLRAQVARQRGFLGRR